MADTVPKKRMKMHNPSLAFWLVCLLAHLSGVRSQVLPYLPVTINTTMMDYSWPKSIAVQDVTSTVLPPPEVPEVTAGMTSWKFRLGAYELASWRTNWPYWGAPEWLAGPDSPYEALVVYASGIKSFADLAITFYDQHEPDPGYPLIRNHQSNNIQLSQFSIESFRLGRWSRAVIPLNHTTLGLKPGANHDVFWLQNMGASQDVFLSMYFGPIPPDSGDDDVIVPPPHVERYEMAEGDQYATYQETLMRTAAGENTDSGQAVEWYCVEELPDLPYWELANVSIRQFRETRQGAIVPMDIYPYATFTGKAWNVKPMWAWQNLTFSAKDFPNPNFVCASHNVDYVEIGNFTEAKEILVAWLPDRLWYTPHAIAGYATFVNGRKDENGKDTVAVHVRQRVGGIDPVRGYGMNLDAPINCTEGNPLWMCPDHILFVDTQMGTLRNSLGRLLSLSEIEADYFQRTGYLQSVDILPIVKALTIYDQKNYAVPYALEFETWMMNMTTFNNLPPGQKLRLPPPLDDWGDAWWETWTLEVLNKYLDTLTDLGFSNLLFIPSGPDSETKYFTYLGFTYGASVLNAAGRCGLNENMERALNETIVRWKSKTDWSWGNETAAHDNTGILQWRGVYGYTYEQFKEWWWDASLAADPLDDMDWDYADGASSVGNAACNQPGFAGDSGFGADFAKIYPPTGIAPLSAFLLGISSKSLHPEFAFEALVEGFTRNRKFQLNSPSKPKTNGAGMSGYAAVKYNPLYQATGRDFVDPLIDHAMYRGSPVAQGSSYGAIERKNPMKFTLDYILFKNMTVKDALDRTCIIINALTRPPCSKYEMEPYLINDPASNQATLAYKWADNSSECLKPEDTFGYGAQAIPPPVVKATTTNFVSKSSGIGRSMVAVTACAMILDLILMVLFFVQRNAPIIRAASVLFSNLILLGGLITLSSILLRTSYGEELNWPQCFGTYWFFAIGYALVLGSLLVKSYRIDRIFNNKGLVLKITDLKLIGILSSLVLVEVILLLMRQFWIIDRRGATDVIIDLSTGLTVPQKACRQPSSVPETLLYVWNAIIILIAAYYAFRTRKVRAEYNENIFTVAAIAIISVISIVIVPVLQLINSSQAVHMLVSIGTILGTMLPISVFAIPKLLVAYGIMEAPSSNMMTTPPKSSMVPDQYARSTKS